MTATRSNVVSLATRRAAKPAPAAAAPASTKAPRAARAPRAVAYSMAILPGAAEFDAPVSLGSFAPGAFADAGEFATAVVGGTLAVFTGNTKPNMREVYSINAKTGLHGARISFGKIEFNLVFGPAHVVAEHIGPAALAKGLIVGDTLAGGMPLAEAAAVAKAADAAHQRKAKRAKPAPAPAAIDKGAAYDAHVAARAMAALVAAPKPAPAARVAAAKAAVSVAVPAPVATVVRVVLEGFGSFDVAAPIDPANVTAYVRTHIVPRVASYFEATDVSVLTAGRLTASMWRASIQIAGKARHVVTFGDVPAASVNPRPLSLRKGLPSHRADTLAAALGKVADTSPAAARPAPRGTSSPAAPAVPAAPARMQAATAAIFEAAARGELPPVPDFSAETHRRYRPRLAEIVALVNKGDIAALEAAVINPVSTSPKAINRYRNAAVIALKAKAETAGA